MFTVFMNDFLLVGLLVVSKDFIYSVTILRRQFMFLLYYIVLMIIDLYTLLNLVCYQDQFLAHLAIGHVSFCHG